MSRILAPHESLFHPFPPFVVFRVESILFHTFPTSSLENHSFPRSLSFMSRRIFGWNRLLEMTFCRRRLNISSFSLSLIVTCLLRMEMKPVTSASFFWQANKRFMILLQEGCLLLYLMRKLNEIRKKIFLKAKELSNEKG